uniref:Transmembrane protein n=1 Tax=Cyclopterus lumpus TaxID=8103 RepID=A0A8C2XA98_CYCLU
MTGSEKMLHNLHPMPRSNAGSIVCPFITESTSTTHNGSTIKVHVCVNERQSSTYQNHHMALVFPIAGLTFFFILCLNASNKPATLEVQWLFSTFCSSARG